MNALNAIYPYRYEGLWVFDDPKVGLVQEPFVSGADVIIDQLTSHIPNAEKGFRLIFSATAFPGFTAQLEWRRADLSGKKSPFAAASLGSLFAGCRRPRVRRPG